MIFFSKYPNFTHGCKMLWNFFGIGHGKGLHDGVGVVIKRFLQREQLSSWGKAPKRRRGGGLST
jgi:hypothetical protein